MTKVRLLQCLLQMLSNILVLGCFINEIKFLSARQPFEQPEDIIDTFILSAGRLRLLRPLRFTALCFLPIDRLSLIFTDDWIGGQIGSSRGTFDLYPGENFS